VGIFDAETEVRDGPRTGAVDPEAFLFRAQDFPAFDVVIS
jgi:hypothetical protein